MSTPSAPLSRPTRALALRAFMAGRRAAWNQRGVDTCPFQADATAADSQDAAEVAEATVERFLARMWTRGWHRATASLAALQ